MCIESSLTERNCLTKIRHFLVGKLTNIDIWGIGVVGQAFVRIHVVWSPLIFLPFHFAMSNSKNIFYFLRH